MKLSKILLVISSALIFNTALAEEFLIETTQLTEGAKPADIKVSGCVKAEDMMIVAEADKVELKKAFITFQSGKDKTIFFNSTLEPNETTRWRGLGYHAKTSCIDTIQIHGYAKHAKLASIKILGQKGE